MYSYFAANSVVQQFLSMIASGLGRNNARMDPDKMLIPLSLLPKMLKLLLNPFITELDCTAFDNILSDKCKISKILLKHALKNCPKISKINCFNINGKKLRGQRITDLLPIELFKQSWSNLKSITSICGYSCNEDTFKLIRENFPNIESVFTLLMLENDITFQFCNLQGVGNFREWSVTCWGGPSDQHEMPAHFQGFQCSRTHGERLRHSRFPYHCRWGGAEPAEHGVHGCEKSKSVHREAFGQVPTEKAQGAPTLVLI